MKTPSETMARSWFALLKARLSAETETSPRPETDDSRLAVEDCAPIKTPLLKLNIGCGTDYRDGFINIDGSKDLPRVDKVIDLSSERLTSHFEPGSMTHILASDIVEHHFHWEAVQLLSDCLAILAPGGTIEIRVPDTEFIIKNPGYSIELKLNLLFGGQDIPQGRDAAMDESRRKNPQFFCHKYGWTQKSLKEELLRLGFRKVKTSRADTNFIAFAVK